MSPPFRCGWPTTSVGWATMRDPRASFASPTRRRPPVRMRRRSPSRVSASRRPESSWRRRSPRATPRPAGYSRLARSTRSTPPHAAAASHQSSGGGQDAGSCPSQRIPTSPVPCDPRPRIGVAKWLQPAGWAEGSEGDFPANHWWAHLDSNQGPLPYQAGCIACPSRTRETQLVTGSHKNCGHLQRNSWAGFPRRPNEAHRGPGIWVAQCQSRFVGIPDLVG